MKERNGEAEPDIFEPDPNKLDREWVKQPRLYHEHALKLADARSAHDRAKVAKDLAEAE